jgi:hypothetical protein
LVVIPLPLRTDLMAMVGVPAMAAGKGSLTGTDRLDRLHLTVNRCHNRR